MKRRRTPIQAHDRRRNVRIAIYGALIISAFMYFTYPFWFGNDREEWHEHENERSEYPDNTHVYINPMI